ncbi:TetR/AcrR family transcriptional regulator [Streptomyces sp. SID3915]|uniref:TetR/AcrR family transcriptional regulator n=1 Tax=Streptomyces sp. SID3915 TaxID=2690263 RepID=UPI00136C16F7|nr:TetR/AcrR family transcriptional regulator [Streptomyces sp. SID3915]MYX72185.1 TetR family transcriptional regulator [Streptomyces sp. SID3915]MYX77418.1 TetR family transcriptional regulator [Streptomyces sp. SID3915]
MGSAADRAKSSARVSVWLDRRTPARTRKADQPAGLDRERITAATVRLLDAEGLTKFSMRRLAAELDVTAMSLYWYVDTKDDLLELALDTVYGEIGPAREDADWPERLRELATSYRKMLVAHVWASALIGKYLNIGPNAMLFSYAVQDVVRATGLPLGSQTGAMSAVFQFVYGFGTQEGHIVQRSKDAGLSQDEFYQQAIGAVRADPELKRIVEPSEAIMDARGGTTVEEMRERDFLLALDILVTGIEAMCAREADRGEGRTEGRTAPELRRQ